MSYRRFWNKFFSGRSFAFVAKGQGLPKTRPLVGERLEDRFCLSAVSNFVWIANQSDNTLSKIDKTTNTVVATIPSGVPQYAFGVAVDEDSVWVGGLGAEASNIARVSKTSDALLATIPLPTGASNLAVDPTSVWVATGGGHTLIEIDKATNTVIATTAIGASTWDVAVDQHFAWVSGNADGFVRKVNKDTNAIEADIFVGGSPFGIAVDQDFVWVTNLQGDSVSKIDKATDSVVATIPTGAGTGPIGVAIDADFVWVANYYAGSILKIDKDTNTVVDTVSVAGGPYLHGVALDGNSVWTDSYFQDSAYRIDKATDQIVAGIPVGHVPSTHGDFTGFAYDALFGPNAGTGSITTIADHCMGGTALSISGLSTNDTIVVEPGASSDTLMVTFNGVTSTVARPSGRIIVTGGDGDDNIQIAGAITNQVWLYGDAGNDRLNAGGGGSLLIGGDGDDQILGGNGRDVMISGQGADKLVGNANGDILIAGWTTQDQRSSADHEHFWCGVLSEWNNAGSFVTRVNNLRGLNSSYSGPKLLPEVLDDLYADEIDFLSGDSGDDWLIFLAGEDKVVGKEEASN